MLEFAKALPAIRSDRCGHGQARTAPRKVLATVVHLLDDTLIASATLDYVKQTRATA
jgi:DNA topoisomerase-1